MGLRRTPLYDEHRLAGGKLVEFNGWEMPVQYAEDFRQDSINALVPYDLEALDAYMELATSLVLRDLARDLYLFCAQIRTRSEVERVFAGADAIIVQDLGAITVPPLEISGIAQYDPHQLTAEFARTAGPLRGALSLTWKHWSGYPGAPEATVR